MTALVEGSFSSSGGVGLIVYICAEDAEREGFSAAAEEGGRGEGADRGVGVEGVATSTFGAGG